MQFLVLVLLFSQSHMPLINFLLLLLNLAPALLKPTALPLSHLKLRVSRGTKQTFIAIFTPFLLLLWLLGEDAHAQ